MTRADVGFLPKFVRFTSKSRHSRRGREFSNLARICQSIEAFELLVPVYGWFTEGLDTADLKDAKALLEALS